jgi:mycothiol synthase
MAQDNSVTLPEEYSVRHARDQDAQDILALIAACDHAFEVEMSGYTEVDIREGWSDLDIERDTWAFIAPDGSLAAYGEVSDHGSGKLVADGYVHPDHLGKGLGTTLARWMEARARELVDHAPEGAQVTLSNGLLFVDQAGRDLLERDGYQLARTFWEMRIALAEEPAEPTLPTGLRLRAFVPGQDERAVFDTVEAAFADHWEHVPRDFDEWLARTKRPDFDPALWLLIEAEDGSIPAVTLGWPRADHGWISTVATRRVWRGKGLAGALLRASFRAFWQKDMRVVALGVDAQNPTGATRVYEAAGMRVATSAVIYQKVLRAGVDLASSASQA